MGLLNITRWPTVLVFALAGTVAVVFAFTTVNLFSHAMANRALIQEFGWEAFEVGALWQILELILSGSIALACWVVFKICESVMQDRYFAWMGMKKVRTRVKSPTDPRPDQS